MVFQRRADVADGPIGIDNQQRQGIGIAPGFQHLQTSFPAGRSGEFGYKVNSGIAKPVSPRNSLARIHAKADTLDTFYTKPAVICWHRLCKP
ncbi:hypothetical protein GCM10007392_25330 [Saccharospirillum salsuginis]|uniref:Uncharacterized protein n=1 Tax=Saccharospirillum salsuginis TaxID=418750 RepID=A0A918NC25_9GAMM|nr:hypothetical protein GCM10007392_25330 [Saccharospirillum salsuginis]